MLDAKVGGRIRKLREEQGITREELASKAEITTKFLYEVENGKKGMSAKNLCKIAEALSSSCDYILLGKENIDSDSDMEQMYVELLQGMNEQQRRMLGRIFRMLLKYSEENLK